MSRATPKRPKSKPQGMSIEQLDQENERVLRELCYLLTRVIPVRTIARGRRYSTRCLACRLQMNHTPRCLVGLTQDFLDREPGVRELGSMEGLNPITESGKRLQKALEQYAAQAMGRQQEKSSCRR